MPYGTGNDDYFAAREAQRGWAEGALGAGYTAGGLTGPARQMRRTRGGSFLMQSEAPRAAATGGYVSMPTKGAEPQGSYFQAPKAPPSSPLAMARGVAPNFDVSPPDEMRPGKGMAAFTTAMGAIGAAIGGRKKKPPAEEPPADKPPKLLELGPGNKGEIGPGNKGGGLVPFDDGNGSPDGGTPDGGTPGSSLVPTGSRTLVPTGSRTLVRTGGSRFDDAIDADSWESTPDSPGSRELDNPIFGELSPPPGTPSSGPQPTRELGMPPGRKPGIGNQGRMRSRQNLYMPDTYLSGNASTESADRVAEDARNMEYGSGFNSLFQNTSRTSNR